MSLSDDRVKCLLEDRTGTLWIGTWNGLNQLVLESVAANRNGDQARNRHAYKFIHYYHHPANPYSISSNQVYSMCKDSSGNLWIGTFGGGLNRYDRRTDRFTAYRHDIRNPKSLGNDNVLTVYADKKGAVWVGTNGGGLNRYDPNTDGFIHYRQDRKSTRLNSSHIQKSRMPSSA